MARKATGRGKRKASRRAPAWTEARRQAFLEALANSCNVSKACQEVGMHTGSVYRERQANAAFRAGWAQALSEGYARLELMLLRRALDGTVKEVRRGDGVTEKVVEYCDRLALQLLKQHKDAAERYQAAEARPDEDVAGVRSRIARKLDGVRRRLGLEDDGGDKDGDEGGEDVPCPA